MWGRGKSPVEKVTDAVGDTVGDVKVGAIKGAAGGALSTLGAKAAGAAQSANNGDLGKNARKAQKNAGKALSTAADNTKKAAQDAQKNAANINIDIDANDIPRLLRGLALLAAGFGTLFAPGSALDASGGGSVDMGKISGQARKGIDSTSNATQQSIKELVDLTKDGLSSLSDALTSGIEDVEKRAEKALDQTEKNLTQTTKQTAQKAKDALPEQKKGGGVIRYLFFGLLIGGAVAFISSPLSGPLGERVTNLRRDLGLGGDTDDDDSKYWPSPPQDATTDSTAASGSNGATPGSSANVTESSNTNPS